MQLILTTVRDTRQSIRLSLTRQTAHTTRDGITTGKHGAGDKKSLTRQTPRQQRRAHASPIKPFAPALQPHRTQTVLMRKSGAENGNHGSTSSELRQYIETGGLPGDSLTRQTQVMPIQPSSKGHYHNSSDGLQATIFSATSNQKQLNTPTLHQAL